jgi:hypothetical protein
VLKCSSAEIPGSHVRYSFAHVVGRLHHSFSVGAPAKTVAKRAGGDTGVTLSFEESIAQDLVRYLFAQVSTNWNARIVDNYFIAFDRFNMRYGNQK